VSIFAALWILWGLAFVAIEAAGLIVKDAPGKPRTLTANVRWLISGAGWWHHAARVVLAVALAWLPGHFGLN
jgi:hypothetical protein